MSYFSVYAVTKDHVLDIEYMSYYARGLNYVLSIASIQHPDFVKVAIL